MAVVWVVRRFSTDLSLWTRFGGFPIVAQLLRELALSCATWNHVIEPRGMIARSVI